MKIKQENLIKFVTESNAIERIFREPSQEELDATAKFLTIDRLVVDHLVELNKVYAPGKELRVHPNMNVSIGGFAPMSGGVGVLLSVERLLLQLNETGIDAFTAHCRYEQIHPFMDGNGRTGRALWLWHMLDRNTEQQVFLYSFLQWFYYQTLNFTSSNFRLE